MNEEKKLDEKTLEGVTGGADEPEEVSRAVWNFVCDNCIGYCVYQGEGGCPYGGDKNAAYADRNPDGSCRKQNKRKLEDLL